jgi:predicted nucleotidyltransferase
MMQREEAIRTVVERIRDGYAPQKIILFGSHVWGEPSLQSDLDVLVIKESSQREVERIREVSRLVQPRPLPLDILVKTPQEIRERLAVGDALIRRIVEQGRVVYDRGAV